MSEEILSTLFDIKAIKFGQYGLKSGISSPIYVDLRSTVSYPELVSNLAKCIWQKKIDQEIDCDILCGVPYTALPIATAISVIFSCPMVMRRKEVKTYGTKKLIEGSVEAGKKCLIIEDIVTSGASVLETAELLRKEGLIVKDCIVVVNREQGGEKTLKESGITLHSIYKLSDVLSASKELNLLSDALFLEVNEFLKYTSISIAPKTPNSSLKFSELYDSVKNQVGKRLLKIIKAKRSNLCVAVDTKKSCELLQLAEELGPYICVLKTHIDILEDFETAVVTSLVKAARKHQFLIMEDRKFADIGNTVSLQYKSGMYKIVEWADIVTVHSIPGGGVIEALRKCASKERACLIIAEMSPEGALTSTSYKEQSLKMAKKQDDFVTGFVSQSKLCDGAFLHFSPGINLGVSGDSLGQKYKSPEVAIRNGADVIIVGRGITNADNKLEATLQFKTRAFETYREKYREL